jgi:hypothetical protein
MELSIVVCDPLAYFLFNARTHFHFISKQLAQNLSDRFDRVLFTVQDPSGELLLSPARQVEVCDGQVG